MPDLPSNSRWMDGVVKDQPWCLGEFVGLSEYRDHHQRAITRGIETATYQAFEVDEVTGNETVPMFRGMVGVCPICERAKMGVPGEHLYPYDPDTWGVVAYDTDENGWLWCCSWMCFDRLITYRHIVQLELELMGVYRIRPRSVPGWFLPSEVFEDLMTRAATRLNVEEDQC